MNAEKYVRDGSMAKSGRLELRLFLAIFLVALLTIGAGATSAFALSPAVATQPASSLGETGATLNALVNPHGSETKIYFEYGTTTSYGSKTAEVSVGSGSSTIEQGQAIGSLSKNTVYHYRVVASNAEGSSQGVDRTFTTVGPPEVFSFGVATDPSGESATVKPWIDPNGQSTTYQIEYGTESGIYTTTVPVPAESAGSEYSGKLFAYKITGLMPGTKYFWRVVASNASGKAFGNEASFLSSKIPGTKILPVSGIWRSKATLSAQIEPRGLTTSYYFEYGTTTAYGSKTPTQEISEEVESSTVTASLSGLKEGTEYHYRLVASNSAGTVIGKDQTFTTLGSTTLSVVGGGELKKSAPLIASSSNLTIGGRPCTEAEFVGEVEENPGARQRLNSLKMQSGATGCTWKPESSLTIRYRAGVQLKETHALEYAKDKAGEVQLRTTPEFRVIGDVYLGAGKAAECEYNFALIGTSSTGKALEPTLTGKTELLKGSLMWCPPGGEAVSGKFTIKSEGKAVEAK